MKIGIDCRIFSSNFTGIGRYTHELVNHIIKLNNALNHPHEIILFFNNPEYHNFKKQKNTKKILVNAKHYSFAEQYIFLKKLYKEKLDIIHFPHFNVPIFYRRPYIVTIHDLTLSLFPGHKMTQWYHRLAYFLTIKNATWKAKKIIAVSNNTAQDLIEQLKISASKIKVIYNGISQNFTFIENPSIFKKTLSKYHITKHFLFYTGVWRNHKNLPRLIQAFHILKKEKNLDLQLVITGKPDPHYPEIQNTIKELRLQNEVILPGLINDEELVHLYNAALFFIFPSLYEGFGLPPLESMKCGTPVVASNTSSVPEICGHANAIYFNPYDENDIAEKIYILYKDVDLQAKLTDRGIEHAEKFSWEKTAKETFKIITECLNHCRNS